MSESVVAHMSELAHVFKSVNVCLGRCLRMCARVCLCVLSLLLLYLLMSVIIVLFSSASIIYHLL